MCINCVQAWDNFSFYSGCLISLTNRRHADSNRRFEKLVRPDIRPKNLNTQGSISSHCGGITTQLTWNAKNIKRVDGKMNSTVWPYRQIGGTLVCVKSTFVFFFTMKQGEVVTTTERCKDQRNVSAQSMRSMWAKPSESIWILWGKRMSWFFSQNNVVMS